MKKMELEDKNAFICEYSQLLSTFSRIFSDLLQNEFSDSFICDAMKICTALSPFVIDPVFSEEITETFTHFFSCQYYIGLIIIALV